MAVKVKVKILDDAACMPKRAHNSDTGYDLKFTGIHKIEGDVIFFKTGISMQPSKGYYFEVVPRSSISKLPLSMANSVGIIDEHYTGEIIVPVRVNHSGMGFDNVRESFPNGMVSIFGARPQNLTALSRLILLKKPLLFQAILKKRLSCDFQLEELDSTDRSSGGFGSTD